MASMNKTVAIGGLGSIGMAVARRLDAGIPGLVLAAVSARDLQAAKTRVDDFHTPPDVIPVAQLASRADVVVECAPASVFRDIAEPAIRGGKRFIPASVGALLDCDDLVALAAKTGARIMVPSGALLGLDAVRAAAQGSIHSGRIVTRKPPPSLAKARYVKEQGIRLTDLQAPFKLFEGSARDAIKGFPANVNVAVALSLAGIGPDRTHIEIWADPGLTRNTHRIIVDSDSARLDMTIESIPSADNPGTGRITPLSIIATLRGLVEPLRVGS